MSGNTAQVHNWVCTKIKAIRGNGIGVRGAVWGPKDCREECMRIFCAALARTSALGLNTTILHSAQYDVQEALQRLEDASPVYDREHTQVATCLAADIRGLAAHQLHPFIHTLRNVVRDYHCELDRVERLHNLAQGKLLRREKVIAYIRKTLWSEVVLLREQLYQKDQTGTYERNVFSVFDLMNLIEGNANAADVKTLIFGSNNIDENMVAERLARLKEQFKREKEAIMEGHAEVVRNLQSDNEKLRILLEMPDKFDVDSDLQNPKVQAIVEDYQKLVDDLHREVVVLKETMASKDAVIVSHGAAVETLLDEHSVEVSESRELLEEKTKEFAHVQAKLSHMQSTSNDLRAEVQRHTAECETQRSIVKDLESQLIKTQKRNDDTLANLGTAQTRLDEERKQHSTLKQTMDDVVDMLEKKLDNVRQELDASQQNTGVNASHLAELEAKVALGVTVQEALTEEATCLKEQVATHEVHTATLEEQLGEVQQRERETTTRLEKVTCLLEEKVSLAMHLEAHSAALSTENERLTTKVECLKTDASLEKKIASDVTEQLRVQSQKVQERLDSEISSALCLAEKMASLQSQLAEKDGLKREIANLKEELSQEVALRADSDALKEELVDAAAKYESLKQHRDELRKQLDSSQQRRESEVTLNQRALEAYRDAQERLETQDNENVALREELVRQIKESTAHYVGQYSRVDAKRRSYRSDTEGIAVVQWDSYTPEMLEDLTDSIRGAYGLILATKPSSLVAVFNTPMQSLQWAVVASGMFAVSVSVGEGDAGENGNGPGCTPPSQLVTVTPPHYVGIPATSGAHLKSECLASLPFFEVTHSTFSTFFLIGSDSSRTDASAPEISGVPGITRSIAYNANEREQSVVKKLEARGGKRPSSSSSRPNSGRASLRASQRPSSANLVKSAEVRLLESLKETVTSVLSLHESAVSEKLNAELRRHLLLCRLQDAEVEVDLLRQHTPQAAAQAREVMYIKDAPAAPKKEITERPTVRTSSISSNLSKIDRVEESLALTRDVIAPPEPEPPSYQTLVRRYSAPIRRPTLMSLETEGELTKRVAGQYEVQIRDLQVHLDTVQSQVLVAMTEKDDALENIERLQRSIEANQHTPLAMVGSIGTQCETPISVHMSIQTDRPHVDRPHTPISITPPLYTTSGTLASPRAVQGEGEFSQKEQKENNAVLSHNVQTTPVEAPGPADWKPKKSGASFFKKTEKRPGSAPSASGDSTDNMLQVGGDSENECMEAVVPRMKHTPKKLRRENHAKGNTLERRAKGAPMPPPATSHQCAQRADLPDAVVAEPTVQGQISIPEVAEPVAQLLQGGKLPVVRKDLHDASLAVSVATAGGRRKAVEMTRVVNRLGRFPRPATGGGNGATLCIEGASQGGSSKGEMVSREGEEGEGSAALRALMRTPYPMLQARPEVIDDFLTVRNSGAVLTCTGENVKVASEGGSGGGGGGGGGGGVREEVGDYFVDFRYLANPNQDPINVGKTVRPVRGVKRSVKSKLNAQQFVSTLLGMSS